MNRFSKTLLIVMLGSSFCNLVKADWDHWGIEFVNPGKGSRDEYTYGDKTGLIFNQVNSETGEKTFITSFCDTYHYNLAPVGEDYLCENNAGNISINKNTSTIEVPESENGTIIKYHYFDPETKVWTNANASNRWDNAYVRTIEKSLIKKKSDGSVQIGDDTDDIDVVSDGLNIDGAAVITKNSDGSIQIGTDGNDIDITEEGLNIDGNPLITQKDNGEIHIGKNSLITTKEEKTLSDGTKVQPLYAEDENGNRIPINIDGSKLLIDGVEVTAGGNNAQITTNKNDISTNTSNISTNKANIKNLGEGVAGSTALTAALSALPQTSKESKLSCGVGTGAYSSRYAVGFGCASKLNERVDVNAGGSYVFGGSKSYGGGTLDSGVVKAGFVFKLGELNKPTQISLNESKVLKKEVNELKAKNNQLLARLEKLEDIALKFQSSSETISVATKD